MVNATRLACGQGLWSADHGSTSSRPRSMKDVATTSMREGVVRSENLRHLRRQSTPNGPSGKAPERQPTGCLRDGMDGAQRATAFGCKEPRTTDVRFLEGPQMKCFLGGQKGWTHKVPWRTSPWPRWPVSRDTAADHERISKIVYIGSFKAVRVWS